MHITNLHLDPNEASDLCIALTPDVLEQHGWDRAFVTVLDEATAEDCIAVLGHAAGAHPGKGWEAMRVEADAGKDKGRTEDAEACARRDGYVYLLGSQFGKKSGPLSARRSWIARVSEESLAEGLDGGSAELEIARTRFALHRAVNDALAAADVDLIPIGQGARKKYIDATIAIGKKKRKRWAGRVAPGDYPINVEGMEFRRNGRLLLGIRYPVSAEGHPLLVEIDDVEALFDGSDELPSASKAWVLEDVGSPEEPTGIRALHSDGDDRFDAIVGDLDAPDKGATVLEDHPEGREARSRHVRFSLPARRGGGGVKTELVHDFGDLRRIEGVVVDENGHAHYVVDEEGQVALRTLLFD